MLITLKIELKEKTSVKDVNSLKKIYTLGLAKDTRLLNYLQ